MPPLIPVTVMVILPVVPAFMTRGVLEVAEESTVKSGGDM
jgi:hypothetical protein